MRIEELKKSLSDSVSPLYLIEGDDAYLRELAVRDIKQRCLNGSDIDFCALEGQAVKANPELLTEALVQYPFLAEKRVVLVRDYSPTAAELKTKRFDVFNNPPDFSVAVIVNVSACEALKKLPCATVVDCSKASPAVIARYVRVSLKSEGVAISDSNAALLAEYCLNDMTRVCGEVQKLAAYCFDSKEVTAADIERLVIRDFDYRIYEMTDKLAQKRIDEALDILNDMLKKNADPQKLYSSVYYYFRRLFFCSVSDKSAGELAKSFGIKEYAVTKSMAQAKKIGARKLKNTICAFESFDEAFKSGKLSIDNALFISVFKILID